MNHKVLLSIYIATYNREAIIIDKVKKILTVQSEDFDIWVLDDCSEDKTYLELLKIEDKRLHIIKNTFRQGCLKDGAMTNWYRLLEKCEGRFALHLNDRDIFHVEELLGFIDFLKVHYDYVGGICDSYSGIKIYNKPEEALMHIPYRAVHPTGIVVRTDLYKTIVCRQDYFKKEQSYIHPHDLVLGDLSQYGNMFEYNKIYHLADTDSFANNKSFLYKSGNAKTSWFSPDERIKEFQMFIEHMVGLNYTSAIKKRKALKIAKAYLYFCTFNYKYYATDSGQTQHYGIEEQKVTKKDIINQMRNFIEKSTIILKENELISNIFLYRVKINQYFWIISLVRPFWEIYKKGTHRKW